MILLLVAVSVGVVIAGAVMAGVTRDRWLDDLWLQLSTAGLQLLVLGILGSVLTAAWERRSRLDDVRARNNEELLAQLQTLMSLYNDMKAIRRRIRSLGLDGKTNRASRHEALTTEQASGFDEQMGALSKVQLGFEAAARQFGSTNLLGDQTASVVQLLGKVEDHLNKCFSLWETSGWRLTPGAPLSAVQDGLAPLLRVRAELRPNVIEPLHTIERMINAHIFAPASAETASSLSDIAESIAGREDDEQ